MYGVWLQSSSTRHPSVCAISVDLSAGLPAVKRSIAHLEFSQLEKKKKLRYRVHRWVRRVTTDNGACQSLPSLSMLCVVHFKSSFMVVLIIFYHTFPAASSTHGADGGSIWSYCQGPLINSVLVGASCPDAPSFRTHRPDEGHHPDRPSQNSHGLQIATLRHRCLGAGDSRIELKDDPRRSQASLGADDAAGKLLRGAHPERLALLAVDTSRRAFVCTPSAIRSALCHSIRETVRLFRQGVFRRQGEEQCL